MPARSVWVTVLDRLAAAGVRHAFGLPGDDMGLLVAAQQCGIEVHLCRDQRHAAYQATAHAVLGGGLGVAFVGKGPAVTHAATGILEAREQNAPLVLLTSGVPADRLGTGAFQELDAVAVLAPLTVWQGRVEDPAQAAVLTAEAVAKALEYRGPVVLEVPETIGLTDAGEQSAEPEVVELSRQLRLPSTAADHASRPVLLVGGGARHSIAAGALETMAESMGAGIMCTASGRGLVDEAHPLFVGVSGLYAPAPARELLERCDLIIALGSALEETATYSWPEPAPPVLSVTTTPPKKHSPARWVLRADAGEVVDIWSSRWSGDRPTRNRAWVEMVRNARRRIDADGDTVRDASATAAGQAPGIVGLLATIDSVIPRDRISVHENGLQDMWSYFFPFWNVPSEADCLVPSEQTPLGFGVASVLGVATARPNRPVVVFAGDGAFDAAATELPSLARHEGPVLIVVLRNGGFGWLEVNARSLDTPVPHSFLDTAQGRGDLCRARGVAYVGCDRSDQVLEAVQRAWALARSGHPCVLEVGVSLSDVPPGMEALAGDFPALEPSS